ncbi:MAG: response regulator [Treponema sp.]|nr:response regulator [Treponema sp.]
MKQVLLIDANPLFQDFLTEKLTAENIKIETADSKRDAYVKLVGSMPDLIIIDIRDDLHSITDFLMKKRRDPNASRTPIIICGEKIPRARVAELIQFGVLKYFNKPIKFDVFFSSISTILKTGLSLDPTPCVLDVHLNSNILFVEIAEGLNREKILLLKYKIAELIENNELTNPKLVLMMSNLNLGFMDGANLELLFDSIIANRKISRRHVKVLSLEPFVQQFIKGHHQYNGVEVVSSLSVVLNSLIDDPLSGSVEDQINERILSSDKDTLAGALAMRFHSDVRDASLSEDENGDVVQVAVVDDDIQTRQFLQDTFLTIGIRCDLFSSGSEFIARTAKKHYDLAIMDVIMSPLSGFDVLKFLRRQGISIPIIVYSEAKLKDAVITALSLGAKSYMVKPQTSETILQKAIEVLHGN